MPVTNWVEEIDFSDLRCEYDGGFIDFTAFRDAVAARMEKSKWAREDEDVRELINDLRHANTEDEYDTELEFIYSRADDDLVWLGF